MCQIFVSLAQFVITGVTSRIFLPTDFGGFAAAISLMGILTLLTTTGLPSFLLKENDLSSNHIASIRKIAILTGALTAGVYLVVSPTWLVILRAPEGIQFLPLMALAQALAPIGGVESALLRRETNLARDALSVLVSFVLAASCGLVLAVWFRQAWVLGIPLVLTPFILAISSRCLQRQNYSEGYPLNMRSLVSFGRKITTQNLGFMVLQQAPVWIVSASLGAGALGNFTKGVALAQMPALALTAVQSRIAQPHWRHLAGRRSFQEAVCDAALLSAGVAFPAFAILSVNGAVIINLWLGPGWELAGSLVSTIALGFGFSIPFTLMAGSFEMRGQFKPARAAQWCMVGAMAPPLAAMVMTRDVLWASYTLAISQAAALVCLTAVVDWHSPILRKRLTYGFLQQTVWAAAIAIIGLFAAEFVSGSLLFVKGVQFVELAVGMGVSAIVWVCTFRWHVTSAMLGRRGLKLPRLLRPARA